MNHVAFTPIGVVHSPFTEIEGMPIQPAGARGVRGYIEVLPEFVPGLKDVDGFSHLMLLYHFHLVEGYSLEVVPFLDDTPRGVFATRAPRRPNPIGLSVVRLESVQGARLNIRDVDIVDGTPLLDIKPFVPVFDNRDTTRIGWLTEKSTEAGEKKSDHRFG